MTFRYSDLPDLSGKTFIITGSTSGLGQSILHTTEKQLEPLIWYFLAQARVLAKHNAHVIVVGRSQQKIEEVVTLIKSDTKNEHVEGMLADLTDLQSVVRFCDSFLARDIPLYSLTLNAATLTDCIELTVNGIETQWQTNVLSHYLMCMRLLPALKKCSEARIVVVSSVAHEYARSRFPLTNVYINTDPSYGKMKRYVETKCANVMLARYLSKTLKESVNENIYVNSLHPGIAATGFWKDFTALIRIVASCFFTSSESAAKTQTYLAASPEVVQKKYRGEYFVPDAKLSKATDIASQDDYAEELISFLESQLKTALNASLSDQIQH